ncbi:MAG: hypothetical protein KIT10_12900 [Flavobacteriales bacterium]|nr:hypothetical protein [Flavobacteriales bacterium]
MIAERLAQHIDAEGYAILSTLVDEIQEKVQPDVRVGSQAEQQAIDITDRIVGGSIIYGSALEGSGEYMKRCRHGQCVVLRGKGMERFRKLIHSVSREREVYASVTTNFVEQTLFAWLLDSHDSKRVTQSLSVHLSNAIEAAIRTYKVHFLIMHLDIKRPFQIGRCDFGFFSGSFFDSLQGNSPEDPNSGFEVAREKYQGKVFVAIEVRAEAQRAGEIALEHCSLAVDVLKICSDTLDDPTYKLSFDMDRRVRENLMNETILCEVGKADSFNVTYTRQPNHHAIGDEEFARMKSRQCGDIHRFIRSLSASPSEIERLILNAIRRFGAAISTTVLHQRTSELFTILESLVVEDNDSRIIDSLCKYCSRLIFRKVEDRVDAIRILKAMYKVRSAWMHHAKAKEFDMNDMRRLQLIVLMVLLSLIQKSKSVKTKREVLAEIDSAILAAG